MNTVPRTGFCRNMPFRSIFNSQRTLSNGDLMLIFQLFWLWIKHCAIFWCGRKWCQGQHGWLWPSTRANKEVGFHINVTRGQVSRWVWLCCCYSLSVKNTNKKIHSGFPVISNQSHHVDRYLPVNGDGWPFFFLYPWFFSGWIFDKCKGYREWSVT